MISWGILSVYTYLPTYLYIYINMYIIYDIYEYLCKRIYMVTAPPTTRTGPQNTDRRVERALLKRPFWIPIWSDGHVKL